MKAAKHPGREAGHGAGGRLHALVIEKKEPSEANQSGKEARE
nr:MAG TPA: hypothetical protein [Bacteriophage sp.]